MDKKEQTKQLIALEMESARLWSSFMLPLITTFLSFLFVKTGNYDPLFNRFVFATLTVLIFAYVVYMRKAHLNAIKKYIQEL